MVTLAASGFGVAGYALAWALMPSAESGGDAHASGRDLVAAAALITALIAMMVIIGVGALPIGDWFMWSIPIGLIAMAAIWRRELGLYRPAGMGRAAAQGSAGSRAHLLERLQALIALLVAGAIAVSLLHGFGVQRNLGRALDSALIIGSVLALVVAPRVIALGRSLAAERAVRIREQERAELAAHLHDSVLQTLALIQRRAPDAREVAALARRQERELRHWLYGGPPGAAGGSAEDALRAAAEEVEQRHRVPIEVVVVGERTMDAKAEALVAAAREAMTNAAKFSAGARIDLFAELSSESMEVFVRDRGPGFDPGAIAPDRRGVRESILARMQRNAGEALIRSAPGAGTEVELRFPAAPERARSAVG